MTHPVRYTLARATPFDHTGALLLDGGWSGAAYAALDHAHPQSSSHRPQTRVRCAYDSTHLYVNFEVSDRYVRCVHTRPQGAVCRDSCVECFVRPRTLDGRSPAYFNIEVNCGGAVLLWCIDALADADLPPIERAVIVGEDWVRQVRVATTMPPRVEPEIAEPVDWAVAFAVPLALFEAYAGPIDRAPGAVWRANFYKCADETSHPHWLSWSPIGRRLSFHQPRYFGELVLGG